MTVSANTSPNMTAAQAPEVLIFDQTGPVAGPQARLRYLHDNRGAGRAETLGSADRSGGASSLAAINAAIPCLTPHCLVATPSGEVAAGSLKPGDKVATRDNGFQTLRWVGERSFDWRRIAIHPGLASVRISAGAFGEGVPARDTEVSPNHLMLVAAPDGSETLVEARHLVGRAGVSRTSRLALRYVHLLFDRHELVLADGTWSESLRPSDAALRGLGEDMRGSLFATIPDLATDEGQGAYAPVRPTLACATQAGAINDAAIIALA